MGRFVTISQAAEETGINEWRLRKMKAEGRLPGFYAASRFYVNLDMFREMILRECAKNAGLDGEKIES